MVKDLRYEYTKQKNGATRINVIQPGEPRKNRFWEKFRNLANAAAWAIHR